MLAVLGMTETQESPRDPTTLVGSRADRSWKVIGSEEDIATRPGEAKHPRNQKNEFKFLGFMRREGRSKEREQQIQRLKDTHKSLGAACGGWGRRGGGNEGGLRVKVWHSLSLVTLCGIWGW